MLAGMLMTYSKSIAGGGEIGLMLSMLVVVVVAAPVAPFFISRGSLAERVQLYGTDDDVIANPIHSIVIKPAKTGVATFIAYFVEQILKSRGGRNKRTAWIGDLHVLVTSMAYTIPHLVTCYSSF